jgi:hypothetical protein
MFSRWVRTVPSEMPSRRAIWRRPRAVRLPPVRAGARRLRLPGGPEVAESWWLKELPGSEGGQAGLTVDLPGASASTTAAPPVYAPPGPMLFLPDVPDPQTAIPAAVPEALRRGCAGVVVNQRPYDSVLAAELDETGFGQLEQGIRHCLLDHDTTVAATRTRAYDQRTAQAARTPVTPKIHSPSLNRDSVPVHIEGLCPQDNHTRHGVGEPVTIVVPGAH